MRVCAFVDGLNLYHALRPTKGLLWLDLRKLIHAHLSLDDHLESITYFTAYCPWDREKVRRHKAYVSVLKSTGVNVVLGQFKRCSKLFLKDSNPIDRMNSIPSDFDDSTLPIKLAFQTYTEKQTDVALGVTLFDSAAQEQFDTAIVVSGDSDLSPAIKLVQNRFPDKQIRFLMPQGNPSKAIQRLCPLSVGIPNELYRQCQFPPVVTTASGKQISQPTKWAGQEPL